MPTKKIVAVVEDLFFTIKISDAAKRAGLAITFVKTEADAVAQAQEQMPQLMILDLNCANANPLALITRLKSGDTAKIQLIGYISHVQGELKVKAQQHGCDVVMARSAFSQNVLQMLKRHAEAR